MTTPPVRRASSYTDLELFSLTHAEIDEAYRLEREATTKTESAFTVNQKDETMTINPCPQCGGELKSGDSGEPDCIGGWWCEECAEFWSDEDLADEYRQAITLDDDTSE